MSPCEFLHAAAALQAVDQNHPRGRSNSESFEKLAERARTAADADRSAEAIELYDRATKLQPGWSEGWWHLGTLLFDAQRFAEARDAFARFVSTEKKQQGPGFAMLGLSEFQLADYAKALVAFETSLKLGIGTDPAFVREVLFHDGILNTRMGNPELALKRLTLAANQIAAAHREAPKDAVFADVKLLDAFGIAALRMPDLPSDLTPEQIPLVRAAGRAQALIALQDRVVAETELKQLVSLYSSQPGVNYMYGVFLLKEHPSLSLDAFRREIEVSPSDAAPRIQLALEFLRTGDFEEGLNYAKEAVGLAPDNFVAHVACGRLWQETGKTDRALQELQTAIKLAPGSPDAHFALSRALWKAGRKSEAEHERAEFERLKALVDAADR
jgi:tetratricopeptide (TPR) repeat protein